jgi:ferrochelatase
MAEQIISPHHKTAIILFNLGGPDSLNTVKPFLFNLFYDKAIINLPNPFRYLLATYIAHRRAHKTAIPIYKLLGGKSPILENTNMQGAALEAALNPHGNIKIFICMRYWHPMSAQVVQQVKKYVADHIILLPLYPQFSTTSTGSSFTHFIHEMQKQGLDIPINKIESYPQEGAFIQAIAAQIKPYYEQASAYGSPKIILSAHGLPEKIIARGDPYQKQIEQTSAAVLAALNALGLKHIDAVISYQSRIGRLAWIGPSTKLEITRAAQQNQPIIIVPISFVSEHSETLVELDIDYKNYAENQGMKHYYRVPALGVNEGFITALKTLCLRVKA